MYEMLSYCQPIIFEVAWHISLNQRIYFVHITKLEYIKYHFVDIKKDDSILYNIRKVSYYTNKIIRLHKIYLIIRLTNQSEVTSPYLVFNVTTRIIIVSINIVSCVHLVSCVCVHCAPVSIVLTKTCLQLIVFIVLKRESSFTLHHTKHQSAAAVNIDRDNTSYVQHFGFI